MTMGHGSLTFKKRDVKSALEASRDAGLSVARVEINRDGTIVIVAGKPDTNATDGNPWDEVLTNAADEKRPS
jgi:hypothetical protein